MVLKFDLMPEGVLSLVREGFSGAPSLDTMKVLLEENPTWKTRLLQITDPYSGDPSAESKPIDEILSVLGPRRALEAMLAQGICEVFLAGESASSPDGRAFLTHSLASAVVLREMLLNPQVNGCASPFTAGLLHHMGKVLIDGMDEWRSFKIHGLSNNRARKTIDAASAVADVLGFPLVPTGKDDFVSSHLSQLSRLGLQKSMEIYRVVYKELKRYAECFNLPASDESAPFRYLMHADRTLAKSNLRCLRVQQKLSTRIDSLQMTADVITRIIKGLEGDPLTFSVLESLMEGFHLDGAFMFCADEEDGFTGYAARINEDGEPQIDLKHFTREQFSPSMDKCMNEDKPIAVFAPADEPDLVACLGKVAQAWVVPACVGHRPLAVIGLGIGAENLHLFTEDFESILHILSAEVSLSLENTRLYNQYRQEAGTDPLTGISNRRHINQLLTSEFARFKRKSTHLTAALFDMDNFKSINDKLGHLAGDAFLVQTAAMFREWVRDSDYIGRFGGDEFLAIFPHTTVEEGGEVVERIREKLAQSCQAYADSNGLTDLSVSVGVAGAEQNMTRFDELINAADDALYEAKASGRNRSHIAQHSTQKDLVPSG